MAKRKTKKTESVIDKSPQIDLVVNPEDGTTNETSHREYIGPNYKSYIIMYPDDRIDPRAMSPDEIEATIKKYPRTEAWWKK